MANEWNFSKEVIGSRITILSGNRIHIDGISTDLFHRAADEGLGNIVSAHWNPNGVLVVNDDKGFVHHYLGLSHKFTAHNGDESYFTNSIAYKRALEDRDYRGKKEKKLQKRSSEKVSSKKGPWWWRGIKWIFKSILKLFGSVFMLVLMSKDDSK